MSMSVRDQLADAERRPRACRMCAVDPPAANRLDDALEQAVHPLETITEPPWRRSGYR